MVCLSSFGNELLFMIYGMFICFHHAAQLTAVRNLK